MCPAPGDTPRRISVACVLHVKNGEDPMDINEEELYEKCDHDACHCVPGKEESAIVEGKSVYCSSGCRDGAGCRHEHCACANLH